MNHRFNVALTHPYTAEDAREAALAVMNTLSYYRSILLDIKAAAEKGDTHLRLETGADGVNDEVVLALRELGYSAVPGDEAGVPVLYLDWGSGPKSKKKPPMAVAPKCNMRDCDEEEEDE